MAPRGAVWKAPNALPTGTSPQEHPGHRWRMQSIASQARNLPRSARLPSSKTQAQNPQIGLRGCSRTSLCGLRGNAQLAGATCATSHCGTFPSFITAAAGQVRWLSPLKQRDPYIKKKHWFCVATPSLNWRDEKTGLVGFGGPCLPDRGRNDGVCPLAGQTHNRCWVGNRIVTLFLAVRRG